MEIDSPGAGPMSGSLSMPALYHAQLDGVSPVAPHRAMDKLTWGSESCATLTWGSGLTPGTRPSTSLSTSLVGASRKGPLPKGQPKQLRQPVRQMSSRAFSTPSWSFQSTDPRFGMGDNAVTPGSRLFRESRSAATLPLTGTSPASAGAMSPSQSRPKSQGRAVAGWNEAPHDTDFGFTYDPKTDKDFGNAPRWKFANPPAFGGRSQPEWKPEQPSGADYESAEWLQSFSADQKSAAHANAPRYTFGRGLGEVGVSPAPSTYGITKRPKDFNGGHEMRFHAPDACGRQPLGGRPSSAAPAFGSMTHSRSGESRLPPRTPAPR